MRLWHIRGFKVNVDMYLEEKHLKTGYDIYVYIYFNMIIIPYIDDLIEISFFFCILAYIDHSLHLRHTKMSEN